MKKKDTQASLKVHVSFSRQLKKGHIKSLNLFNHWFVFVAHVQLQILFWSLVLSQSLDLFRLLLFHNCVFCLNEFDRDKQIDALDGFWPG